MAEPATKDLHAELFGDEDSDEEYQEQQQQPQQEDAEEGEAPAPDAVGDEEQAEAPEYQEYEAGGDAAEDVPQAAGQEEYAPGDYQPEDQWLDQEPRYDEAQEADEEDELEAMFKPKKKRKQQLELAERKAAVESTLARMEVAAELDIEANTNRRPAVHKLQELPEVEQMLVQRDLHDEFLDGGVLGVFKAWLEPMPDGSLPNAKVRAAVLRLLLQLNFFFEDRKEQLKKSGLGHVIMFLSKLPDELPTNRRMARDLVEKWSRPIFEQYRNDRLRDEEAAEREADELRTSLQRSQKRPAVEDPDRPLRPSEKGFRFNAAVPEKAKLNYKRQPVSAMAADAGAGARGKSAGTQSDRMIKKLADISKRSKQSGKAAKVSVQGRELVMTAP